MIYLKSFRLPTRDMEDRFLMGFSPTCFDSYYPMRMFPSMGLRDLDFADITILCGGNGSGKSTLLNIIAEKLSLERKTLYNRTYFFEPFLKMCGCQLNVEGEIEMRNFQKHSRIITSDDVFNHILEVRDKNDDWEFKRDLIFRKVGKYNALGKWEGPKEIHCDDPESVKAYADYVNMTKKSASRCVKENIGMVERTYSNGENGFLYFTDAIQEGGLYLLDEPENSLSAELQLQLVQLLYDMARFYKCQFILSSHSPFILSLPNAKIYNLEANPVSVCKWSELANVRIYHEFFKDHDKEFD